MSSMRAALRADASAAGVEALEIFGLRREDRKGQSGDEAMWDAHRRMLSEMKGCICYNQAARHRNGASHQSGHPVSSFWIIHSPKNEPSVEGRSNLP